MPIRTVLILVADDTLSGSGKLCERHSTRQSKGLLAVSCQVTVYVTVAALLGESK